MTLLEGTLLKYPSAPWDWLHVSANPSVSFQFMLDHPEMPWVPRYVSENVGITQTMVVNHPEYPWYYEGLCSNPNMSIDFFREFIIKPDEVHRVDWHLLSCNPSITMDDVVEHPNYKWDDRYLSSNPNLTSGFILSNPRSWYFPAICSNPGITTTDIFKTTLRSFGEWNYRNLSENKNLPIVYVNDNITKDWNFHSISVNASITDLHTYHRIKWDGHGLSMNKTIGFDYIMNNPRVGWHAPSLLMNPSIRFETIMDNYDWFQQLCSPESFMCSNPWITADWIDENYPLIDWKRISRNPLQ